MDVRKAITATEAARRLGVDTETVRRAILKGQIRAFMPGREYLVDPASLARFTLGKPGRPAGRKDTRQRTRRTREEVA